MRIIGYTYEADVHCPACSKRRFGAFKGIVYSRQLNAGNCDVNGISYSARDSEGNPIHPVFGISEDAQHLTHCGDCRQETS